MAKLPFPRLISCRISCRDSQAFPSHGKRTRYSQFFFLLTLSWLRLCILFCSTVVRVIFFLFRHRGRETKTAPPAKASLSCQTTTPLPLSSPHICQRRGGEGKRKRVSEKFCPHATTLPSIVHYCGCEHCRCHVFPNNMSIGGESDILLWKKIATQAKQLVAVFGPYFIPMKKLSLTTTIGYVWFFSYHHLRPE